MRTASRSLATSTIFLLLAGASCGGGSNGTTPSGTAGDGSPSGAAGTTPATGTAGTTGLGGNGGAGGMTGEAGISGGAGSTTSGDAGSSGGVAGGAAMGGGGTIGGGGVTGRGGVTGGGGGVTGNYCFTYNCGASLCGNGVRDTCTVPMISCQGTMQFTETCDGASLNGETCATRGYGSGSLACSGTCSFDDAACVECAALGANLVRCGNAPIPTDARVAMSMAASDTEVALLWADPDPNFDGLRLTRLAANLDRIGTSKISEAYPDSASIAPLPSGWAIGGHNTFEVFVHAVDASGVDRGRTVVDRLNEVGSTNLQFLETAPRAVARPDGGPMLFWQTRDAVRVALVSADGRSATTPVSFPTSTYPLGIILMNAAYVGDAFYIAMQIATTSIHLTLLRVPTDGSAPTAFDALPGLEAIAPTLVTGAGDLRVAYSGRDAGTSLSSLRVQKLDLTGAPAAPPIDLGANYQWSAPVAFGDDTVLALSTNWISLTDPVTSASREVPRSLGITRVAAAATSAAPILDVASLPREGYSWQEVVRRGTDLVVAWTSSDRPIRIARITP